MWLSKLIWTSTTRQHSCLYPAAQLTCRTGRWWFTASMLSPPLQSAMLYSSNMFDFLAFYPAGKRCKCFINVTENQPHCLISVPVFLVLWKHPKKTHLDCIHRMEGGIYRLMGLISLVNNVNPECMLTLYVNLLLVRHIKPSVALFWNLSVNSRWELSGAWYESRLTAE